MMRVGITVWENRISPVFDAARTLLVAEIEGSETVSRELLPCSPGRIGDFIGLLQEQDVCELICGAISKGPAGMLEDSEISLIPFIAGMVDPVLEMYALGKTIESFRMPGCCGNNRCGRIDWYRRGRGLVDLRHENRSKKNA
jgi:predicted Fe-Mo cluster-binding NifX family protein